MMSGLATMRQEPLLWAVAAGIASGTLFAGYDSIMGQALACIVNCILLAALVLRVNPTPRFWALALPVLLVIAAAVGWIFIVGSLQPSFLPDYALGKFAFLTANIAALLSGAICAAVPGYRRLVLDRIAVIACVGLFLGLVFYQLPDGGDWAGHGLEREGRFIGLIGNANVTAGVSAAMAILLAVRLMNLIVGRTAGMWKDRDRIMAMLIGVGLALCVGVTMLTASRFANVLLFLILAIWAGFGTRRHHHRYRRLWLPAVGVALALIGLVLVLTERLTERLAWIGKSWDDRIAMWSHYASVAADQPLIGYGPGSFPFVNAAHLDMPRVAQQLWAVNSPHNVLLQMLIEGGLPYLLLTGLAMLIGLLQVVRRLKGRWRQDDILVGAMLTLMLCIAMVDIFLDMPAAATLFLFLAGLLWGRGLERIDVGISLP